MHRSISLALLSSLVALAACELQPPPKRGPAPPPATRAPVAEAPRPTPPPPAPPAADAGSAAGSAAGSGSAAAIEVSKPCVEAGVKITDALIASAPADKRESYIADRERTVRRAAEACTKQSWSVPAIECYVGSKTEADVRACETKFNPRVQPPAPAAPVPDAQRDVSPDGRTREPMNPKK